MFTFNSRVVLSFAGVLVEGRVFDVDHLGNCHVTIKGHGEVWRKPETLTLLA